jgi:hypothetical protein
VHKAFEIRGEDENAIVEERISISMPTKYGDVMVSGQPDLIDPAGKTLYDYKCTSVWTFILGGKPEWETQLNIYRWMATQHLGLEIEQIKVVAIFRDWRPADYKNAQKQNPFAPDYPECKIGLIDIPLIPLDAVRRNVIKLIERHMKEQDTPDAKLPFCNDEARWCRNGCFAVRKAGGKRALPGGVHQSFEDAKAFAAQQSVPVEIDERPGRNIKCESYCDGAPFCNQWKQLQGG